MPLITEYGNLKKIATKILKKYDLIINKNLDKKEKIVYNHAGVCKIKERQKDGCQYLEN